MKIAKVLSPEVNIDDKVETTIRVIPSAEASMMEGLAVISTPDERRKAVDRMVENAKNFSVRNETVNA